MDFLVKRILIALKIASSMHVTTTIAHGIDIENFLL